MFVVACNGHAISVVLGPSVCTLKCDGISYYLDAYLIFAYMHMHHVDWFKLEIEPCFI